MQIENNIIVEKRKLDTRMVQKQNNNHFKILSVLYIINNIEMHFSQNQQGNKKVGIIAYLQQMQENIIHVKTR